MPIFPPLVELCRKWLHFFFYQLTSSHLLMVITKVVSDAENYPMNEGRRVKRQLRKA